MNIQDLQTTQGLVEFIQGSPTAFHAVAQIRGILSGSGYQELSESEAWKLEAGGQYFVVRNESSVIAFRVPEEAARNIYGAKAYAEVSGDDDSLAPQLPGFMIAAAHSDSPSFKIKENPEMKSAGYVRLNVEKYGGMLIHPWFDRPLSVAGRLIVKDGNRFVTRLVDVNRDLLMIPSLAIHMDHNANEGHKFDAQKEILPIMGLEVEDTAEEEAVETPAMDQIPDGSPLKAAFAEAMAKEKKAAAPKNTIMSVVADAANVPEEDIVAKDLFVYSRTPGTVWGANKEFVSSGRLDDLQCVFGNLLGFLTAREAGNLPVYAVFDNEEVGSGTKQGADSTFLSDVIERMCDALGCDSEMRRRMIAGSFMVSADNAHAVHPNYTEKADPKNQPKINEGIVIKHNANQKYTTDAISAAVFKEICAKADVPVQEFTNNSNVAGGSTLGNIANAHVSLNTVDIGLAQLAMHSPYETAGVKDTGYLIEAMRSFFQTSLKDEGQGIYTLN